MTRFKFITLSIIAQEVRELQIQNPENVLETFPGIPLSWRTLRAIPEGLDSAGPAGRRGNGPPPLTMAEWRRGGGSDTMFVIRSPRRPQGGYWTGRGLRGEM
jgi:hypothetical protein